MFNFVNKIRTKRKGKAEYQNLLSQFIEDGRLDETEKTKLSDTMSQYGLVKEDVKQLQQLACSTVFKNITKDLRITNEEKNEMEQLLNYFELKTSDFSFDQHLFNKCYALGQIERGILPNTKIVGLNVELKDGEKMHWCCSALLRKRKSVTNRINYSGPVASIRIMKGLRYRVGSVKFNTEKSEHVVTEDQGNFWLTDQRIGFHGMKKSFSFPYSKIHSFEVTGDGILIFKEGKESAYLVTPDDAEVPCAIISAILNRGDAS